MKTRNLIYSVSKKTFLFATLMLVATYVFPQTDMTMKDVFGVVEEQVEDAIPTISSTIYKIAGLCLLIGAVHIAVKLYQGNTNVAKEIGLYLFSAAFICLAGYICGKFME